MSTPRKNNRFRLFSQGICFLTALLLPSLAYATFVTPKRVNIPHGRRAAAITVFNSREEPMVFTFEWERRAQLPGGDVVLLEEGQDVPGYRPVHDMLVLSPRRVVLQPGEQQKIRILARRPADLEKGEYHSHLKVKSDPLQEKVESIDAGGGLGMSLSFRAYLSIPIFLHHGKTNIDLEYTNITPTTKDGKDHISYVIENNSTRSLYAYLEAECTTAEGMVKIPLGTTRVYSEGKRIERELFVTEDAPRFSSCSSMTYKVYALNDVEYKMNEPIRTYER